jgi:hypothetical protein
VVRAETGRGHGVFVFVSDAVHRRGTKPTASWVDVTFG